jgi:periplasmic divalent cation tolerance protein
MTPTLLVTTVDSAEAARSLARAAVEQHLAACVQITPIESVFAWQGAVQQGAEWRLLFKTTADRVPALESYLLQHHPYELPALHAMTVTQVHSAYGRWIDDWVHAGGA